MAVLIFMVIGGFAVVSVIDRLKGDAGDILTSLGRIESTPRELRKQDPGRMAAAERALKARDPKWDSRAFLERAKKGFSLIQTGWSNQDLSNVQGFLSDGVFERFSLQIEEQRGEGIRDHMEDLKILNARIVQIESDPQFDTMHVAIRATAVNYRVSLKDKKRVDGSLSSEEFEEVWSFLRRPGGKTLEKPGLIEGACPACGAPIEIARAAKCAYCQAFLRSGEYDWVLAEITQACEWAPIESKAKPGIAQLKQLDPGFGVQQIEDRVSVLFWRYVTAFRIGKVDPLVKHVYPSFLDETHRKIAPKPNGLRTTYRNAAIGSVAVQGATLSGTEGAAGGFDKVLVEVRWSWKPAELKPNGQIANITGNSLNRRQVFVLVRKSGVKTNASLALSSSCCNNCGAPEGGAGAGSCQYCGTALNDGTQDWVLERITEPSTPGLSELTKTLPPDSPLAQMVEGIAEHAAKVGGLFAAAGSARRNPASREEPGPDGMAELSEELSLGMGSADGLRWLAQVMFSDGKMEKAELEMLKNYARTHGIPQYKFNEIFYAAKAGDAIPQGVMNPQETAAVYRELVQLSLADGSISDAEMQMLREFGRRGKMSSEEMTRILEMVKKQLPGSGIPS